MERSTRSSGLTYALAGIGLVIYVLAELLPIHFFGPSEFRSAFPSGVGTRLTMGFLIRNITMPVIILVGIGLVWSERRLVAAGVFLASGMVVLSEALTAPFYARVRLQPMVLLTLWGLAAVMLLAAAWTASRAATVVSSPTIPPPPEPIETPADTTA
jgi:hypothetical protein